MPSFLHGVEVVEIDYGPRPIQTVRSSVIGLIGTAPDADAAKFPLNTPVMIAGNRLEAAALDTVGAGNGTLPDAIDGIFDQAGAVVVVVRVDEGLDLAATISNVTGGVDVETGAYTGVHAFLAAESVLGFAPRILCAPGFTSHRPEDPVTSGQFLANPVVAELLGIADRLRAVIIADGPDTNDADAITYAADFGSRRVYLVDPGVKVFADGEVAIEPASARVAGMIAKSDAERGFWWSPSNREMYGIVGTTRPIDFTLGDADARANLLNEQNIATIIRQDGYRLWGNRTLSSDPKWAFINVVRTADMINESLLRAHLWAVDRNITKTYLEDVVEGVNNYLSYLTTLGAILGGKCWADSELNTPSNLAAGKVFFDFDFTPPAPAERVTFRSRMVNDYFEQIV
ncbi:phage tail sheath subtilisin-like domain-containing protein [Geoalkalibacter subterraneus]|uniref:Tail protein n=1 Tax=Geoalkalibacter subterraneus TaxID=483547 RepID=A0A0B5FSY1_9BACT|nr:phage tail sheath subtilisin-like domain-containing protein [Geoalkalibacter subterraneus]AJF07764.1 tail protein [Geoalkalibacter subterraneus]